ncbi:MAG: M20/M25/M40 family metallo-hydrolase [bacterium]
MHENPELSGVEYNTNLFVIKELLKHNVKIINNKLSIVCFINKNKKETIAFRSELDALPIIENKNHKIHSKNNNMHACGHDVHTSALLAAIPYIKENYYSHNIALVFQSKEETGLGAKDLSESMIFNDLNITKIIALHVWPNLEYNKLFSAKNLMFGSYELDVDIEGENNHISSYKKETDATYASYLIYNKLFKNSKNYISHLGEIKSGTLRNISSNKATLKYSIRFKNNNKIIEKISKKKIKTKCKINYKFNEYFPPLINDDEMLNLIKYNKIKTLKSAEDFGYYSNNCKTFYLLFGLGKGFSLHSENFYTTKEIRKSYYNKIIELIDLFKI